MAGVYDSDPRHPAVRRERKNDARREGWLRAAGAARAEARRGRQQTRGAKGAAFRNCLHHRDVTVDGRRVEVWFHACKGPRRLRAPE